MNTSVDIASQSPPSSAVGLAPVPPIDEQPLTVVERRRGWQFIDLRELWRYRELFFVLSWRDIKVRYKQTVLGIIWAVLQPLSVTLVLSVFFYKLADIRTGAVPYPLFAYAGLLPWMFFATAIGHAGQSVVGNRDLVTKVYFPRLLLPMSAAMVAFVDFLFGLAVLILLMFAAQRPPTLQFFLYIPPLLALLAITAVGIGTWLAALTVAFRDVRHALPFLIQLWMLATPAIYMRERADLNPRWGRVLPLNPMDGLIANFRAAALGLEDEMNLYALAVSSGLGLLLLLLGCLYFRRVERSFADVI